MEKLELDGYCEELKLAFEYQELQHFENMEYFHRNEDSFQKQQERDKKKIKLCEDNGITLVEIPYEYSCKNPDKLENF